MPSEISSDTKSMIIALRPEGYSMPKIVEKLKQLGKSASLMTVRRVLQRQKLEQQGVIRKKKKLPPHQLPVACCKRNVSKVKKWISIPNPSTQKEIASRLKVCLESVKRIFKKLGGVKRLKKRTTHYLTAKMAAQRLERGEKFLKKLSRRKLKLIFTMDEMLISTDDINSQTDFYYKQQGVVVPESWRKLPKKNWPKPIMSGYGYLRAWKVADIYRPIRRESEC